ncbi:hypothetical protein DACRYDRAFT_23761, partial [Dacryopinax primogenitus]
MADREQEITIAEDVTHSLDWIEPCVSTLQAFLTKLPFVVPWHEGQSVGDEDWRHRRVLPFTKENAAKVARITKRAAERKTVETRYHV